MDQYASVYTMQLYDTYSLLHYNFIKLQRAEGLSIQTGLVVQTQEIYI